MSGYDNGYGQAMEALHAKHALEAAIARAGAAEARVAILRDLLEASRTHGKMADVRVKELEKANAELIAETHRWSAADKEATLQRDEQRRELLLRAEAAEHRVKELEGLVSIEEKIAIKHTQLIAELSARNAHLRKSLGEIDELKAQLKGTMQAGGYEHFTAQVRNAQEQAHNAIYVAQQLEKKVAALESRDKQQREALQAAAEVFESLDAVEWPQSDCDVFHGNAGCCPVDYSQAQQAVNAALTNDQTTNT